MPAMNEDEARRRFAAEPVARLATVDEEGRPHLVPVVFAVRGPDDGGRAEIVTAVDAKPKSTQRLKRLRNIAAHPSVCLLADAYDADWTRLWWARADGEAHVVPPGDGAAHAAAVTVLRAKYAQYADRPPTGPVILVAVRRWLGWRASPLPGPPGRWSLQRGETSE
ncbi:TIGR03668 family PPOX class F420-dependent oxidoreductase [Streptomyces sp. NPDC048172]|uniref:TIGR03668 family PPOX class F420-dependent oxidoreductase n=1 Tax=Streptomyces sp. NPDC048172 TaxID=3365505 RepID=UPI00371E8B39